LEGNVSTVGLSFTFEEAKRSKKTCMVKKKCGCVIITSYELPCACILAMKTHAKKHIQLGEIKPHWKRLSISKEEGEDCFF